MNFRDPKEEGSRIKSFLRRNDGIKLEDIDKKSATPADNKEFILKKLTETPPSSQSYEAPRLTYQQRVTKIKNSLSYFRSRTFKDNIPLFMFVSFSCWILWKMEAQLDSMRRKVIVQKTIKQQEIEKENELIERGLRDNRFEDNVQIQEVEPEIKYRYEEDDDDDDDEGHINTKGDLFLELTKQENVEDLPPLVQNTLDRANDPRFAEKLAKIKKEKRKSEDDYYLEKF